MKSLERRFTNIAIQNPNLSSILCFYRAITGQNFSKQTVHRWFHQLVEKGDYQQSDLKTILLDLERLNERAEDNKKQGVTDDLSPLKPQVRYIPRPAFQIVLN